MNRIPSIWNIALINMKAISKIFLVRRVIFSWCISICKVQNIYEFHEYQTNFKWQYRCDVSVVWFVLLVLSFTIDRKHLFFILCYWHYFKYYYVKNSWQLLKKYNWFTSKESKSERKILRCIFIHIFLKKVLKKSQL